jgi:hypothetical protein
VMDLAAVRTVLAAARALGGPVGTSIELCILNRCSLAHFASSSRLLATT